MNIFEKPVALERSSVLPEPWSMADVVVVLPTYQEAANLPTMVAALFDLPLPALRSWLSTITRPTGRDGSPRSSLTNMVGPALR